LKYHKHIFINGINIFPDLFGKGEDPGFVMLLYSYLRLKEGWFFPILSIFMQPNYTLWFIGVIKDTLAGGKK